MKDKVEGSMDLLKLVGIGIPAAKVKRLRTCLAVCPLQVQLLQFRNLGDFLSSYIPADFGAAITFQTSRGDSIPRILQAIKGSPLIVVVDDFTPRNVLSLWNLGAFRVCSWAGLEDELPLCLSDLQPGSLRRHNGVGKGQKTMLLAQLEQQIREKTADYEAVDRARSNEFERRRALEGSVNQLVQILWETVDLVAICTLDGRVLYLNRSGRALFGLGETSSLEGVNAFDAYSENERRRLVDEILPQTIANGIWRGEGTLKIPGGNEILVSQVILAHKDEEGNPQYISTISRDISAIVKAGEDVKNLHAQLERLLRASPVVVHSSKPSPPYELNYISDNFQDITGYPVEPFYEEPSLRLSKVHPDDLEMMREGVENLQNLGTVTREYRLLHADGTYHWMKEDISMSRDDAGSPLEILGSTQDITARKQSEERLARSEDLYRKLAETSQEWIYIISKADTIEYMNTYGAHRFGLEPAEMIGHARSEFFPPSIARFQKENIQRAFNTGQNQTYQYLLPLGSDSAWLETYLVPLRDPAGEITSVLGVSRDISERKKAEDELQKALLQEKELGSLKTAFISMVSHQFRTPLSTILSSAELLECYGEKWSVEKRMDHLQRIQEAANRMEFLLRDILVLGKLESSRYEVKPKSMDLLAYCTGLANEMALIDHHQHPIEIICINPCNQSVMVDEWLLRQVLENILGNSLKFSRVGSTIEIVLSTAGDEFSIRVRDHGIGIPAQDFQYIYDSFFRGANAGKTEGTGLGLTIVRNSLERMDGRIEVTSQEGIGTEIAIRIPIHKAPSRVKRS